MNLKLKDEITKILIEKPGSSISEIAKKTKNYYSYTHKLISLMEKQDLIRIEKSTQKNKEITKCYIKEEYKHEWIAQLKKIIYSLKNDIEIKTALALMYILILVNVTPQNNQTLLTASYDTQIETTIARNATINPEINWNLIVIIIVTALIIIKMIRKRF